MGAKESYEKYPSSAIITATVTPSNTTSQITWACSGDGISISTYYYQFDNPLNPTKIELPSNQRRIGARYGENYDGHYTLTVSADGISASYRIRNIYYKDKDGDRANGIYEILSL